MCDKCGLSNQCACWLMSPLNSTLQLLVIQHPNEAKRPTNSAKILQWCLPNYQHFTWSRVAPPTQLLDIIAHHPNPILLFPTEHSVPLSNATNYPKDEPLFIILDATWQEAKKMWRQSSWLQTLYTAILTDVPPSQFNLRRNQRQQSLCTCEVGIALLGYRQELEAQADLKSRMLSYFAMYQADRSGHALST